MGKIYEGKGGFRVELNSNQFVHCYPAGGGFEHKIPLQQFLEEFKAAPDEPFRAAMFSIDGSEEFPGYHKGLRWNGWAMPRFEHAVVLQLQKRAEGSDMPLAFYGPDGSWSTICHDPDENETWQRERILVNGNEKVVYSIGAGSWCWDVTEFPPYK